MKTYSEIILQFQDKLNEMGLGEIPSRQIREKGDEVFSDNEVNDNLLRTVLKLEITGRSLTKLEMEQEATRSQKALAQHRREILDLKLKSEISKAYPLNKMKPIFQPLYDGFTYGLLEKLRESVSLDADNNLVLGDYKPKEEAAPTTALDRLLQKARISRPPQEETIESRIVKVAEEHNHALTTFNL
jgi:hypothetical protein